MALPNIQCDVRSSLLSELSKEINHAVKLPLNYLRMVDFLVNKEKLAVLQELDSKINTIASAVAIPDEYMNPAFDMGYAAGALQSLSNCAGILGVVDKKAFDDAIALMTAESRAFSELPNAFKKYIGNALYRGAAAKLNSLVEQHVIGKIDKIRSLYQKALNGSGVTGYLKKMEALINCAAGACSEIDQYIKDINQHYKDLRLKDNAEPKDIVAESEYIMDPTKKTAVSNTLSQIDSIRSNIKNGLSFTGITGN
jgi:hypothetical protein